MTETDTTYPQTTDDGRTVWACCTSTIGPLCEHRTRTIVTRNYRVGDRCKAMRMLNHGTALCPGTVVDTYTTTNQRGDQLQNIVVDFGDGQQRRYVDAGISDYVLKVVPA